MSNKEELAEELLSVLRDALGPECRLPKPLTDFARYGTGSVTVRDGRDGAVELTAVLTGEGLIERYSIRLIWEDGDGLPVTAVGPLRMDFSQAPEEYPSITFVLPLVIRLDLGGERLCRAQDALEDAGYVVEVGEGGTDPVQSLPVGDVHGGRHRPRPGQRGANGARSLRLCGQGDSVPGQSVLDHRHHHPLGETMSTKTYMVERVAAQIDRQWPYSRLNAVRERATAST